jgi:Holliday junction resolvase-like predicted endonuclease
MSAKAVEYRAKASECAELAANTLDPASKRILEETAEHWAELAAGLEKYEARLRPTITRSRAAAR